MSEPCKNCGYVDPEEARVYGPQETTARALAKALGASLPPCRKQVAALLLAEWPLGRIQEAIHRAEPGEAPWDWTKKISKKVRRDYGSGPAPSSTPQSIKELAAAIDMTEAQYREYHSIKADA